MRDRKRRSTRPDKTRRAPQRPGAAAATALDRVTKRFAAFRSTNPPLTRIPDRLRAEAVDAWQAGVSKADLRRHCGVTGPQLEHWQQSNSGEALAVDSALPPARVLSVVDNPTDFGEQVVVQDEKLPLEILLGGWSVAIRPVSTLTTGE